MNHRCFRPLARFRVPLALVGPILVVSGASVGCAVGNQYELHKAMPVLKAQGGARLAVGTHDQRLDITSGDKEPDFIGVQRGGFGNAFSVTTASDQPLASDITTVVVRALQQQGFAAEPVELPPTLSKAGAEAAVGAKGAQRAIVITILEFKSDTYTNVGFDYAFEIVVLDAAGQTVAKASTAQGRNLKGSFWNPPAHAKQAVPRAFREALEELLNRPEIAAAIAGQPVVSVLVAGHP